MKKSFGGLRVVDELSLDVRDGEIVSLIGPNGAGKTTVFNLVTGVYAPDGGEIVFEGRDIAGLPPHKITTLGIARTFQTLRLFLNMSVKENVMAAAYGHTKSTVLESMLRLPRARREEREIAQLAEEKLAFFGQRLVGYRWDQPAYSLSYANRRRLEIARAMATKPRLLLLDEPAAGMNPVETHEMMELIGRLREEGWLRDPRHRARHARRGGDLGSRHRPRPRSEDRRGLLRRGRDRSTSGGGVPRAATGGVRVSSAVATEPAGQLLQLSGIDTYYGEIHILQSVDLHVGQGELVCLLGGNASGKSTTLKTILGIVRPRRGTVQFDGHDITRTSTSERIRRGMAIVPENRRVFAPMTVLENLEMGAYLRPRGDIREDLDRVYALFPLLHERRSQLAGTMSGGEQQMLAMGRALMSHPRLLLMDEPSMGLAPILVERSFQIIKQVHEAGVALLVVEQNANVSLSIADRGYVLSTGRVVLEGKASELIQHEELRKAYLGR